MLNKLLSSEFYIMYMYTIYITPVMNLSLTQGVFPSKLKLASVVPIYNKMHARRCAYFFFYLQNVFVCTKQFFYEYIQILF